MSHEFHYNSPAVYVSTSTRLESQDHEALTAMNKPNYHKLVSQFPHGHKAVGSWADGSEESYVIPVPAMHATKIADQLGAAFHQKQVALFIPNDQAAGQRLIYRHVNSGNHTPAQVREKFNGFFTLTPHGLHVLHEKRRVVPLLDGEFPDVSFGLVSFRNAGEHYQHQGEYKDDIRPHTPGEDK